MGYLALAVACSLGIGMIFKYSGRRSMDRVALLTVNYLVAFIVAGGLWWAAGPAGGTPAMGLLALGVAQGALFIGGFFLLALATETAGMSLALGVMRVSVVIPFVASWLLWDEVPTVAQGIGMGLAGVAFFLIARQPKRASVGSGVAAVGEAVSGDASEALEEHPGAAFGVLLLLFLSGGLVNIFMKTFDEAYAQAFSKDLFLLIVFGVAFVIGGVLVVRKGVRQGVWPRGATLGWGVVLGVVNYGSAIFLLEAIEVLSGPFVFPANDISIVIGAALLGVFFWGERLSRANWLGLGLAAVALLLLNL